MNIGQVKIWSWAVAGSLTLGLSYFVYTFISELETKRALPDQKHVREVLESVEPVKVKTDGLLSYEEVKRLVADFNWTGKPPPKVEATKTEQQAPKQTVDPVKDLVRVLMVKVDLADPKGSNIYIKYKPKAGVLNTGSGAGFLLKEGEHLAKPREFIRVDSIRPEGVVFAFDDEARAKETLGPEEFDARAAIVAVGPDGVILPPIGKIPTGKGPAFRPGKTTKLTHNRYVLGTEDVKYMGENYAEILASQVRTGVHRDPLTGKYDGIEIKEVTPGSVAAEHGAQAGDVIKSINGHPVNSQQEAITFVKNNSNKYSIWEVVIENKGKERTVIYESPSQ
jgi:hypothetical protein